MNVARSVDGIGGGGLPERPEFTGTHLFLFAGYAEQSRLRAVAN
ncbi:hypothetical protein [Nocardia sp. NPDC058497]